MKNREVLFKQILSCLGLLMMALATACGSSGDGSGASAPGSVSVSLTDAPACGFDAVNVTVSKVRIHQSDSASDSSAGWTDITLNPPRKINLLNLNDPTQPNFALENLGVTSLEAGHYTQLRLVLDRNTGQSLANSVVLSGTTAEIPLDTPSAIQSGIKLIHQFTVNSGQRVDLLLDFDACHSIVKTGNGMYKLKPVIKVIPTVLNGINGFVDKTLPNVVVSAQQNGNIVRATMLNTQTGEFFLAHLAPGSYDVVITADSHATAVVSGVPVPNDTIVTPISTSGTPFSLANSSTQAVTGTVTLNNPSDDDGTVVVAAKQSLSGGPTVTVKSVIATVLDAALPIGDYGYNMTLPTGAPALAPYSAIPPPITPTAAAQSAVAKMYTVKGSAETPTTVYATQSPVPSPVDITVVTTQNFTLTP